MNIHYVDKFGFLAGEIVREAVCAENMGKCVFEPLPAANLPLWCNWLWSGSTWLQATDNRGRIWYCASATEQVFRAQHPDDVPPDGYLEWLPGCDKVVTDDEALQTARNAKWAEIKLARSVAEYGGFTWDCSMFDSDVISQARIQGAVQLAGMAPDFSIDWTLKDNNTRTLGAADMAAVGVALGQHVASQHARARKLRARIDAAATAADLAGIEWLERHEK